MFDKGFSKIDGFNKKGKHNYFPSRAVDIIPYKKGHNPFDGSKESEEMFYELAEEFKKVAKELNIDIVWGRDWNLLKICHTFKYKGSYHPSLAIFKRIKYPIKSDITSSSSSFC